MAFYSPDPAMGQHLEAVVRALELDGRPGLAERLSITWLRYIAGSSAIGRGTDLDAAGFWGLPLDGASWNGGICRYPASVVKLVYLAAAEAWLRADLIPSSPELTAALAEISLPVDHWHDVTLGTGRLERFIRPRDLDPELGPEE